MTIARNDGVDRTVVRNATNKRGSISIRERHNERKNEMYSNPDIMLDKSQLNVHFKRCDTTYLQAFDKLCEDGSISTRGLKEDANIIDEMIFDVNTAYFENNGGYEYAKEFYAKAYEMAVKETGGEQYILSAVMHADERNKALSEELGKDVFHYHLHVVYIPVVEKKILWSKRCKDKALVGTVKEVITQVSHSKKWSSEKYKDDQGKTHLISSYSKLQDRFFDYMNTVGYRNIERGEKGSSEENLHHTELKVMKEKERLEMLQNKVVLEQKSLDEKQLQNELLREKLTQEKSNLQEVKSKKTAIKNVDAVAVKSAVLDSSKVVVDKTEFEDIRALAKKQIVHESKEKRLTEDNKKLAVQVQELQRENQSQKTELNSYKSIKNRLSSAGIEAELSNVKKLLNRVLEFVEKMGFKAQLEKFLNQKIDKMR